MVKVSYGIQSVALSLAGLTVGEIAKRLSQTLGLPDNYSARVNGQHADNENIVAEGDAVAFERQTSEKGR